MESSPRIHRTRAAADATASHDTKNASRDQTDASLASVSSAFDFFQLDSRN